MITSNIQASVIDQTWPVLLQYKNESGTYIILASGIGDSVKQIEGVVVYSTIQATKVGTYSRTFSEEFLKPFEGSLSLSNRRQ